MHQTLQLNKFEGINFKYDNGFSQFQSKNIQIKQIFVINVFLFLHATSHIEKFKGANFENGHSFFQIPAKNTQIRHFL